MPARRARELLLPHVDERHAHARGGGDLRDAGAHLAGADDRRTLRGHAAVDLDHDRVALPAARADRGQAAPAAAPAQLVHERADEARAGGADGMPERDRAAVDVDALGVDAEVARRLQRRPTRTPR